MEQPGDDMRDALIAISPESMARAAAAAPPEAAVRLDAIASLCEGCSVDEAAWDAGVPTATVKRWVEEFSKSGISHLASLVRPIDLPDDYDPESLSLLAEEAQQGLERTAFKALASAYRGASLDELSAHYFAPLEEITEWIELLLVLGPEALTTWFRRPLREDQQTDMARVGRSRLPIGYDDVYLRRLLARMQPTVARRLLVVALAYEGRTFEQIASAVKTSPGLVRRWIKAFIQSGVYGLQARPDEGRVPRRNGYGASTLEALAKASSVAAFRSRILVISDAYRGMSWREIASRRSVSVSDVRAWVQSFESGGPEELAHGEATLTPALRLDYDASTLRRLSAETSNRWSRAMLEAVARLYDGESMFEVAHGMGLRQLECWVSGFQREGHRFAEIFDPARQAPSPPKPRQGRAELAAIFNPAVIATYLESASAHGRKKVQVLHDLSAGNTINAVCETHRVSLRRLRKWIEGANEQGLAWLAACMSPKWRTDRSRSLLAEGRIPEEIARSTGIHVRFVLELERKERVLRSVRSISREPDTRAELKLATGSWSEPLATCARVVTDISAGRTLESVCTKYQLTESEVSSITDAFSRDAVAGLACDPVGFGRTAEGRKRMLDGGVDLDRRPCRISVLDRVRSYRHLVDARRLPVLKAVAMAAEGAPITLIARSVKADAGAIREWIARYNADTAATFVDASRDRIETTWFDHTARRLEEIATSIPEAILARNVAIVAMIGRGASPVRACDVHEVTHEFVHACVLAYRLGGISALATMSAGPKELTYADPSAFERPAAIELVDDDGAPPFVKSGAVGVIDGSRLQKRAASPIGLARRPRSAVHLHPNVAVHLYQKKKPGHRRSTGVMVAMTERAIEFETKAEALSRLPAALDEAAAFGIPGVVMVGGDYDAKGGFVTVEDMIGGDENLPAASFVRLIGDKLDADALPAVSRWKTPWQLVPFFTPRIDDDEKRAKLLAAQREMHDYVLLDGSLEVKRWMPSSVAMRPSGSRWKLSEVSALIGQADSPMELFDFFYD